MGDFGGFDPSASEFSFNPTASSFEPAAYDQSTSGDYIDSNG
jgi:hypothetical protein